jgi:DNA polymerase elongation subunit (family B)
MTFRNCYYDVKKGIMHLWETINSEKMYTEIPWVPYVYIKDKNSDIKTIDGISVSRKNFNCFYDYYDFCKKESEGIYENKAKPEIQFLAERYHGIPDDKLEIPKLLIYSLDIEVNCDVGFPHAYNADWPITVISICDNIKNRIVIFGEKPYTGNMKSVFIPCSTEEELLRKFFNFMYRYPCDVITGWSIINFDLPYLINRSNKIFGTNKKMYALMSPIKNVRTWTSKATGDMNIDIAGVHILDYHHVYKWYVKYTDKNPENYKLDTICNLEIDKGKIDYSEYNDLNELYKNNWNKYVEYNAIDSKRVIDLENKLGYIRLIQALSLLTKCPMKYYASMSQLVEGALLTYYRRKGLCAPYFKGGEQETFEAAIVKEPDKGLHSWIIDIDIKSSYPSHVITLNMSIETFVGRILYLDDLDVIKYVRKKEFPSFKMNKGGSIIDFNGKKLDNFNKALKRGVIAIAPCGTVFSTGKTGVMADIERSYFLMLY